MFTSKTQTLIYGPVESQWYEEVEVGFFGVEYRCSHWVKVFLEKSVEAGFMYRVECFSLKKKYTKVFLPNVEFSCSRRGNVLFE